MKAALESIEGEIDLKCKELKQNVVMKLIQTDFLGYLIPVATTMILLYFGGLERLEN